MRGHRIIANRLLADRAGNILPMAAMGMLVMVALVGGAVDMSRAYQVRNRLQNACDAGVLAGRRAVTNAGYNLAAETQANTYFNANYDSNAMGTRNTVFLTAGDTAGNKIGGKASTDMPMLLMQVFKFGSMHLVANCASTMGVGNSDVTMVLDITGSMNSSLGSGTKISALKSAMKNFYSTVQTATQGSNARIRYALVPYSTTVNVGHLLNDLNPDYLRDKWTVQSRAAVMVDNPTTNWVNQSTGPGTPKPATPLADSSTARYSNTNYSSLTNCNAAKPADATTWSNSGSPSTGTSTTYSPDGLTQYVTTTATQLQVKMKFVCLASGFNYRINYYYQQQYVYTVTTATNSQQLVHNYVFDHYDYKPVEYDVSQYKTFHSINIPVGNGGANVSVLWDGCIEERDTVNTGTFSFSSLTGMSPKAAYDVDIDTPPDPSDPATQWAPAMSGAAFERGGPSPKASANALSKAGYTCVPAARAMGEMTQSEFNTYADSLTANGNTYLDIGMIWGARLSSPDGIYKDQITDPPANGGNVSSHVIFMTDGTMETISGSSGTPVTMYSAWGNEYTDRRVTTTGLKSESDARHSQRYRAVCDAIKAKGIRIWAVQFDTQTTLGADLAYCASPNSAFVATNAAQLNAAFQEIAKQVGELRVLS